MRMYLSASHSCKQVPSHKHGALNDDNDEEEGDEVGEHEEVETCDFEGGHKAPVRHQKQAETLDVDMLSHPSSFFPPMGMGPARSHQQRCPAESGPSHECEAHYLDPAAVYSPAVRGESASSAENLQGCDEDFDRPVPSVLEALRTPHLADLNLNSRPGSLPSSPARHTCQQRSSAALSHASVSPCATPSAPPSTPKKRADEHLDSLFDAHLEDNLARRAMKRAANVANHQNHNFSMLAAMMPPAAAPAVLQSSGLSSWASTPPASPSQGASSQAFKANTHRPAITITTSMAANPAGVLGLSSLVRQCNGAPSFSHQQHQPSPLQPQPSPLQATQLSLFMEALLKRSLSGPLLPATGALSLNGGNNAGEHPSP